jgi:putative addiction module component (TIGR02574 family)
MSVNVGIRSLTAEQRLALIGDIWDSLAPAEIPLSKEQREELDRRLDDLATDPHPGIPWDGVLQKVRERSR